MNQETLVFTTSPKKEVKVNRPAVYEAGPIGGVFLLNHDKSPLMPVTNDRARWLLDNKQAAVYRRYPFTLILNKSHQSLEQAYPIEFKVDPGSKTTGLALVAYVDGKYTVIWAANLGHRGDIKSGLESRLSIRRGRRNRHTRYRPARFMNRVASKKEGWLAPSLLSRVHNVANWLTKLRKYVPITSVAVESVRFDTQKLRNPEINGVGYQQGELMGYEVREYLLEKFNRKCAYCGKEGVKLQIEHVTPRSRGGTDSVSNLVIACQKCNQKKGSQSIEEFLAGRTDDLKKIKNQLKTPLKDAAAVNATRNKILEVLRQSGLPVTDWTGARTKMNRLKQGYPKDHWIDAVCVGETGEAVSIPDSLKPLQIKAMGRGNRLMQSHDAYGFPNKKPNNKTKRVHGIQTGDIVEVEGVTGRVSAISVNSHSVSIPVDGKRKSFSLRKREAKIIQRTDGYKYDRIKQVVDESKATLT